MSAAVRRFDRTAILAAPVAKIVDSLRLITVAKDASMKPIQQPITGEEDLGDLSQPQ